MNERELLLDMFGRVDENVPSVLEGLSVDDLMWSPGAGANPIGWLIWHIARVGDAQVAELIDAEQLWVTDGWAARFGLEPDPDNHGYGHTAEDVAAVRPESAAALAEYYEAAAQRTNAFIADLGADDLDRIVDRNWDPPVTLGVRLVSIVDDQAQHLGQAAYVKGLLATS